MNVYRAAAGAPVIAVACKVEPEFGRLQDTGRSHIPGNRGLIHPHQGAIRPAALDCQSRVVAMILVRRSARDVGIPRRRKDRPLRRRRRRGPGGDYKLRGIGAFAGRKVRLAGRRLIHLADHPALILGGSGEKCRYVGGHIPLHPAALAVLYGHHGGRSLLERPTRGVRHIPGG